MAVGNRPSLFLGAAGSAALAQTKNHNNDQTKSNRKRQHAWTVVLTAPLEPYLFL